MTDASAGPHTAGPPTAGPPTAGPPTAGPPTGGVDLPMVLFDLDGTLVDSRPGIAGSVRAAAGRTGVPRPTDAQVDALIGPPFPRAFVDVLGVDETTAAAMMDVYREVYGSSGLYDVAVYPAVPETLRHLYAAGVPMAVTTSKPEVYARRVLDHLGLTGLFVAGVHGASLDGAVEGKAAVVGLALAANPGCRAAALVGDRHHDVEGARAHGLPAVGVTWGFGGADELTAAGATSVVDTPAELGGVLARLMNVAIAG